METYNQLNSLRYICLMFRALKNNKVSGLFLWLMFTNLILVNINRAMFVHTHHLPDGTTVVHAHPFDTEKENDDQADQHQHTKTEYVLLDNFNHFVDYHTGVQFQQSLEIVINYNITSDWVSPEPPIYHPSLRAPPFPA